MTEIAFNDIARHSSWPKRLLSLEAFSIKFKTEQEVIREFQNEKWHDLLQSVKERDADTLSLEWVESRRVNLNDVQPYFEDGAFFLATHREILDRHFDAYQTVLEPYLDGASALVELGAGYGSKILGLADRSPAFTKIPLVAAEYTENGCELIRRIGHACKREIAVGNCDFRSLKIDAGLVPENAVIFTSSAVHYVPELSEGFSDFLLTLKPKAIIHFEPFYEHFSTDSIHELMCRRYMELNDYTRNLMSVINKCVESGRALIQNVMKNSMGANPFLPISVVEWKPVENGRPLQ